MVASIRQTLKVCLRVESGGPEDGCVHLAKTLEIDPAKQLIGLFESTWVGRPRENSRIRGRGNPARTENSPGLASCTRRRGNALSDHEYSGRRVAVGTWCH